jgi:hypothetical protein
MRTYISAAAARPFVRSPATVSASVLNASAAVDGAAFSMLSDSTNASEPRGDSPRPPGALTRAAAHPAQPGAFTRSHGLCCSLSLAVLRTKSMVVARKFAVNDAWRNRTVPIGGGARPARSIAQDAVQESLTMSAASASPKALCVSGAQGGLHNIACTPASTAPATNALAAPRKRARTSPRMPDTVREAVGTKYPELMEFVRGLPSWFCDAVAYYRVNYDTKKFFEYVVKPSRFQLHLCCELFIEFEAIFAEGVAGWERDSNATADNLASFKSVPVVDSDAVSESVLIVNRYIAYLSALDEHYRVDVLCSSQEGSEF